MSGTSKLLTAEEMKGAADMTIEQVPVPEWGGHVFVRSMDADARDEFEEAMRAAKEPEADARGEKKPASPDRLRANLAAATVCDEAGNRLFTFADAAALGKKNATALTRIFNAALKLNPPVSAEIEAAKKNSDAGPSDGSPSASP